MERALDSADYVIGLDSRTSTLHVSVLISAGIPASQQGYPQGYPQSPQSYQSGDKGSAPPYQQNNNQGNWQNQNYPQSGYPQNNYQQGYNDPQYNYQQQQYNNQPAPAGYPVSLSLTKAVDSKSLRSMDLLLKSFSSSRTPGYTKDEPQQITVLPRLKLNITCTLKSQHLSRMLPLRAAGHMGDILNNPTRATKISRSMCSSQTIPWPPTDALKAVWYATDSMCHAQQASDFTRNNACCAAFCTFWHHVM